MSRSVFFHTFPQAVPVAVCDAIIAEAKSRPTFDARVYRGPDDQPVDTGTRKAKLVMWDAAHWTSGLLFHFAEQANGKIWQFDLKMSQGSQFAAYGPGDWFDWHKDEFAESIPGDRAPAWAGLNRKLSVVLNLTDPAEYQGGELRFRDTFGRDYHDAAEAEKLRARGSVVVFPAYTPHTVTKVTAGLRFSLTSWVIGPPFR